MWLLLTFLSILSRAVYGLMSKVLTEKVKLNPYTQRVSPSFGVNKYLWLWEQYCFSAFACPVASPRQLSVANSQY